MLFFPMLCSISVCAQAAEEQYILHFNTPPLLPVTSTTTTSSFLPLQVSHTEPDHSYLVPAVLDLYPDATVVASKVALNFLTGLTNRSVCNHCWLTESHGHRHVTGRC